jgi:hypothetical protein
MPISLRVSGTWLEIHVQTKLSNMKTIITHTVLVVVSLFSITAISAQGYHGNEHNDRNVYNQNNNTRNYNQHPQVDDRRSFQPYRQENARQEFRYYPNANVYYNAAANRYWYMNNGAWVDAAYLPNNCYLGNESYSNVYYNGYDVWRDNAVHVQNYRRPYAYDNHHARVGFNVHIGGRF